MSLARSADQILRKLDEVLTLIRNQRLKESDLTTWIVLTGAPSSGKSTLLADLAKRGHHTRCEQARKLFEAEIEKGRKFEDLTKESEFLVDRIFHENLKSVESTPRRDIVIFDRALPDVLVFGLVDGVDVRPYVSQCCAHRFACGFVLDQVNAQLDHMVYHNDSQRAVIEMACQEVYKALGTPIYRLPSYSEDKPISLAQRASIVEKQIQIIESKVSR